MDRPLQNSLVWHHWLIVFVAGLVFFTNLGAATLFDEDEPKNAVCGREMFLRGDWIVPTFNAELRTDKPILIYWIMLSSFSVFGVSEFAARLGSAVLAVGTALLTYHLGRMLFRPRVGLLAAIILVTCLMFSAVGRAVTPDSMLIFCTTAAFTCYVWSVSNRLGGSFGPKDPLTGRVRTWDEYVPPHSLQAVPMYVAMGFAVLAKGPIGVLLPCSIIGLNLLLRQQWDRSQITAESPVTEPHTTWPWRCVRFVLNTFAPARIGAGTLTMHVPLGAIIVLAIALPWYIAVGRATDGEWIAGFLGNHNVGRFLEAKENHSGPIFYYLIVVLMGTFPWSAFLPVAVWHLKSQLQKGADWSPGLVFVGCWAGFWIAFFSCASTKLPNYILPAYPAIALLIAAFLDTWQRESSPSWDRAIRWSCYAIGTVGVVLLIAIPIVTSLLLPGETWLVVIGAIPLAGALLATRAVAQQDRLRATRVVAGTAVTLAVMIVGIAPAYISKYQDGPYFGTMAKRIASDHVPELATFEYFAPTLVFYAETPVERLKKPEHIPRFFGEHPEGLLLTRSDRLESLRKELPADITVLAQQRRFLRRHDLVLLGRVSQVQAVQAASRTTLR